MSTPFFLVLSLSTAQNSIVTTELWCVAKNNAEDYALQSALDWAGSVDCKPIQQGAPCYDASDIQNTASYVLANARCHPAYLPGAVEGRARQHGLGPSQDLIGRN